MIFSLFCSFLVILIFQHCSDFKIIKQDGESSTFASQMAMAPPPPDRGRARLRLVIFVDQSYSMIQGKCPTDLDGDQSRPDQKVAGCVPQPGIDPEMHRYRAIQQWLDELENLPVKNEDAIKVALIPFSGGKYQRPRRNENSRLYQFQTLQLTRQRLDSLELEQNEEMQLLSKEVPLTRSPPEPKFMGTTAPRSTIDYMYNIIRNEMTHLEDQKLLTLTPFQVIYISDGVFKPLTEHWEKVWKFSGCDKKPSYALCYDLKEDFKEAIGDINENTFANTATSLRNLVEVGLDFKTSYLKMRFVKIHPDRIDSSDINLPDDKNNPRNLFDEIKNYFKNQGSRSVQIYSQFDENKPFSIMGGMTHKTYKLDHFYTINLNAFVNDYGELVSDSDGDGLPDQEEIELGYNPLLPRSNGVCLDIISHLYGCKLVGCSADRDLDGDGLNSCEETALRTNPYLQDTDGDGLLDSHEVLRGLNPLKDDRLSVSSSDALSDYDHFISGVSNFVDLRNISPRLIIKHFIESFDFKNHRDTWGQEVSVEQYHFNVINMPLSPTKALNYEPLFLSIEDEPLRLEKYPLGSTHGQNENQLVHIVLMRSEQDPEDIYRLFLIKKVIWQDGNRNLSVNIDFSRLIQIDGGGFK